MCITSFGRLEYVLLTSDGVQHIVGVCPSTSIDGAAGFLLALSLLRFAPLVNIAHVAFPVECVDMRALAIARYVLFRDEVFRTEYTVSLEQDSCGLKLDFRWAQLGLGNVFELVITKLSQMIGRDRSSHWPKSLEVVIRIGSIVVVWLDLGCFR